MPKDVDAVNTVNATPLPQRKSHFGIVVILLIVVLATILSKAHHANATGSAEPVTVAPYSAGDAVGGRR